MVRGRFGAKAFTARYPLDLGDDVFHPERSTQSFARDDEFAVQLQTGGDLHHVHRVDSQIILECSVQGRVAFGLAENLLCPLA